MTNPHPTAALRDIAAALQAMLDTGAFELCFEHVRLDMATLPDRLVELADEIDSA